MFSLFRKLPGEFLKGLTSSLLAYTATAIFFLYPLILSIQGFSPIQIGLTWITFELALFFSRPWTNWFLNSLGTRKGMITGAVVMAFGIALLTAFPTMFFILSGRVIQGIGWGLFIVSYSIHNAWVLPIEMRGLGFGLAGIAPVLPQVVFFPIGEWLILYGLSSFTLIIAILSCLLSASVALRIKSEHEKNRKHHNLIKVLKQAWTSKEMRAVLLSGSAFALLAAPVIPYIANAAKEWGTVGTAFLLPASLASLIIRIFIARVVDHYGGKLVPAAFITASVGLLIACWIETTPAFLVGGVLFGTGNGLAYPLIFSEISRVAPEELMTPLFTLFNTFIDVVWLIVPFFAAGIAELAGFGGTLKAFSLMITAIVVFLTLKIWPSLQQSSGDN